MNKLKCEVIRDLLPSYIDKICSEESKEIIEEHILECNHCNKLIEKMKKTEIISSKIDEKEIDYMKKIKKHIINKSLLNFALLISFIIIGMTIIVINYGNVPIILYYIILPILMSGSYIMLSDYTIKSTITKWKIKMSILSTILICYSIILEFLILKWINSGIYPFGIKAEKIGPFIYYQFLSIAIIQIIIFISTILISLKTKNSYKFLLNINITGSCLAFSFISILKRFDTIKSFILARNSVIIIFIAESLIISLILMILDKKTNFRYTNS